MNPELAQIITLFRPSCKQTRRAIGGKTPERPDSIMPQMVKLSCVEG
jgi:hypothetical protein